MKISNSEILNKVKNKISDKKEKSLNIKESSINETEKNIENEIKKWIDRNAERVAKDIVKEEVKKIFR